MGIRLTPHSPTAGTGSTIGPSSDYEHAAAALVEVGRATSAKEAAYVAAREQFVAAARALAVHRARWQQRAGELLELGGSIDPKAIHEHAEPADVELPTEDEVLGAVA